MTTSECSISDTPNIQLKCEICDFTANSDAEFRAHIRAKHKDSRKFFKCWTCDFVCTTKVELTAHNDKYYYSHRMALNKNHKKYILEEFEQLKKDGFTAHNSTLEDVSKW